MLFSHVNAISWPVPELRGVSISHDLAAIAGHQKRPGLRYRIISILSRQNCTDARRLFEARGPVQHMMRVDIGDGLGILLPLLSRIVLRHERPISSRRCFRLSSSMLSSGRARNRLIRRCSAKKAARKARCLRFAFDRRRVLDSPMRGHRLAGPDRADLARGIVANGEDEIELGRAVLREFLPALRAVAVGRKPHLVERLERQRDGLRPWDGCPRKRRGSGPLPSRLRIASARIERAELPVHRNSTL